MKRRILGLVLMLSILAAFAPWVQASSGTCGDNVTYTYYEGTLTISGTGDMWDYPNASDSPFYRSYISKIVIEEGITSIGERTFSRCDGLNSVIIPNSVTEIGASAFASQQGLTSVYISDLANYLNIDFKNSSSNPMCWASKLFIGNNQVLGEVVIPDTATQIPNYAFHGCDGITNVKMPNSITSIGDDAFRNCSGLTAITISNSITSIGVDAFKGCSSLTNVTIPDNVTTINGGAFEDCKSLKSITIPDNVTKIGSAAFYGCSELTDVYITDLDNWCEICFDGVESNPMYYADNLYLNGNPLKKLIIPDNISNIREYAFCGCSSLTSVNIPNSVESIGDSAFWGCSGIENIMIGSNMIVIGCDAFAYCSALTDVYYNGTKSYWNNTLYVDPGNDYLLNATIHFVDEPCFSISQTNTNAKITNTSDEQQSATVIIAKYNDNRLLQVSSNEITFNPNETKIYDTDNNTRVFVWDSLKGMRPLDK